MLVPHMLNKPLLWKKPRQVIFVNSMSDLFHEKVPFEYIEQVFDVMRETPQHTYQILTKRSARLLELSPFLNWTDNIWQGVSVEDERVVDRIGHLRDTDAKIKFLSLEPLIGPLHELIFTRIDWVIIGGESGDKARIMQPEWALDLVDQCKEFGVPVFVKQMGTAWSRREGDKSFKGDNFTGFPEKLQVREYP